MEEEVAAVGGRNEGEMALIVGGARGLKRCRSRSSSSSENLQGNQKSVYLVMYSEDGLVLYCVNVDDNGPMKTKFCRRCCSEFFPQADDDGEGEEGKPSELERCSSLGLREITPSKSGCDPFGTIVVSLGSTLYVIGGLIRNISSRKVFYLDTNRLDKGWMQGPDMLNGRSNGTAVAVEGKIYVFGGNDLVNARDPWSEVLDPIKNEWTPLSPPCVYLDSRNLMALTWGEENKVMVGAGVGAGDKYVYDVKTGIWEKYHRILRNSEVKPAAVGNMLYWIRRGDLYCFNMKTERTYSGKIKGSGLRKMYRILEDERHLRLLHLGGKEFCYLSLDDIRGENWSKIGCIKFVVSKRLRDPKGGGGTLKASVVRRDTYIVDQPLDLWFWYGVVLDGKK